MAPAYKVTALGDSKHYIVRTPADGPPFRPPAVTVLSKLMCSLLAEGSTTSVGSLGAFYFSVLMPTAYRSSPCSLPPHEFAYTWVPPFSEGKVQLVLGPKLELVPGPPCPWEGAKFYPSLFGSFLCMEGVKVVAPSLLKGGVYSIVGSSKLGFAFKTQCDSWMFMSVSCL